MPLGRIPAQPRCCRMVRRILFCDTNILRYILDQPSRVDPFLRHLEESEFTLVISLIQAVELTKLDRYHAPLADLILLEDAHFFSWWKAIVSEEVQAYPDTDSVDPLSRPSIRSHYPGSSGRAGLATALSGQDLSVLWREFEDQKIRYKPSWNGFQRPCQNRVPRNQSTSTSPCTTAVLSCRYCATLPQTSLRVSGGTRTFSMRGPFPEPICTQHTTITVTYSKQ